MYNQIKSCILWAASIIAIIFTLTPESIFGKVHIWTKLLDQISVLEEFSYEINIILNRIFVYIIVLIAVFICSRLRKWFTIKGSNYTIRIEYGNLLRQKKCQRIISFDECYTTKIGNAPNDIKPGSICGQYLANNPKIDMGKLIKEAGITPERERSKYQHMIRYKSGTLIPYNGDLLLAFVPLNENGNGEFSSYEEYLDCLAYLWKEINKYYSQQDVCIPILGSTSLTRIPDESLNQQKLLDIIIASYKLSPYKIDKKLRIICKKAKGFSINNIGMGL